MVDVGAHQGGALFDFARDGWRVLAFEPDPANRAILDANTTSFARVSIDARAIASVDGDHVALFTSEVSAGISTMAAFHPSHKATTHVETVRLDTFLASIDYPAVSFLKTDTEGFDLPVLRTYPWSSNRPLVIVCEFENRKTLPLGYSFEDLGDFLLALGYAVYVSEWFPVAEYGERHTWRSFHSYPTQLSDPHGWGNFVAVQPHLARQTAKTAKAAARRLRCRRAVERVVQRT
jgi:FkbM family methyltransferase